MGEDLYPKPFIEIEKILSQPIAKKEKKKKFAELLILLKDTKEYLPKVWHKNINLLIILISKKPKGSTFKKIGAEISWLKKYAPVENTY